MFYMTENCDNHNQTLVKVKMHLAVAIKKKENKITSFIYLFLLSFFAI